MFQHLKKIFKMHLGRKKHLLLFLKKANIHYNAFNVTTLWPDHKHHEIVSDACRP